MQSGTAHPPEGPGCPAALRRRSSDGEFLLCRFVFRLDLFQQLCQCHACSSSRSTPAPAKCANRIPAAYVYVSDQGTKYHRDPDCSGMIDPDRIALEDARSMGFAPCQKCY